MASRIPALILLVAGTGFVLLGLATRIPLLGLVGIACLIGGWAARTIRFYGRAAVFAAIAAAMFAIGGSLALIASAFVWWRSQPPDPGAFYDAPAVLPPEAGTLVRQEPFTRAVPSGARSWRILYTTTRSEGVAAVASGLVLAPTELPAGPRPVITWTHGTTGVMPGCAPSVLPDPFPFEANVPAINQIVAQGWVLVLPDYAGLGTAGPHPYLIGDGEARSALDAVRAAREMKDLALDDRTIVWGHSQGGHAALWTGMIAPAYAPDVNVIGVAALAPATDLGPLTDAVKETPVGRIMLSYLMTAYSATYPDVRFDEYVGPRARTRRMAGRCLSGSGALASLLTALTMERAFFAQDPGSGPLGARLAENTPRGVISASLLIAQGRTDQLVLPAVQDRFMRQRCDAGQDFDYWTYAGRDHLGLVAAGSPLTGHLLRWTKDRIAGAPAVYGCRTIAR